MTKTTITNPNQSIEVSSKLFKGHTTKHKYLVVNDIYKLAKLAEKYYFYNVIYGQLDSSIAKYISQNNTNVIGKLPEKLVTLVQETIELFRNIIIDDEFNNEKKNLLNMNFKRTLCFSLVSKKLLKETNPFKVFIPFTGIRHLANSGEKYIGEMLKDIQIVVYNYNYIVNIVWPITTYDIEIDDYTKRAYEIIELVPPIK